MTDSKTATEHLREMLDARGVDYEANRIDFDDGYSNIYTEWGDDDKASYIEYVDGTVLRMFGCTPEQAVAATLGSNEKPCFATDYTYKHCKYSVNRGWVEDTKFYIPAFYIPTSDTLGSGECEFELNADMTAIRCDKCGYELPAGTNLDPTRYCGGCGRVVKR